MPFKSNQTIRQPYSKFVPNSAFSASRSRYADHEWPAALSGRLGYRVQEQSHRSLANYLFVVIRNHFALRQSTYVWLAVLDETEIGALAEDLVQVCLLKLSRDDYALLDQYSGQGPFTSWAAQIALNEARSELRRVRWGRLQPLEGPVLSIAANAPTPEQLLHCRQLLSTLNGCLAQLPQTYRTVLVRCVMHNEPAADVAPDLQRSAQAVYNLIARAKKRLRALLEEEGYAFEDFALLLS